MSQFNENKDGRRAVLKFLGGTAVLLPLAGLAGCSGKEEPTSAMPAKAEPEAPMEDAAEAVESTMDDAAAAKAPDAGLPLVDENGSQAKSLGYVHDASTVDAAQYTRYQDGQACSNCALYTGGDAAQGGCSIFPGKAVKASGWCSVYAPKAG